MSERRVLGEQKLPVVSREVLDAVLKRITADDRFTNRISNKVYKSEGFVMNLASVIAYDLDDYKFEDGAGFMLMVLTGLTDEGYKFPRIVRRLAEDFGAELKGASQRQPRIMVSELPIPSPDKYWDVNEAIMDWLTRLPASSRAGAMMVYELKRRTILASKAKVR